MQSRAEKTGAALGKLKSTWEDWGGINRTISTSDFTAVSLSGAEEYGARWDNAKDTLIACGLYTPEIVANIVELYPAMAFKILFEIAQDPPRARALAKMPATRRMAEIANLSKLEPKKFYDLAVPSVQPLLHAPTARDPLGIISTFRDSQTLSARLLKLKASMNSQLKLISRLEQESAAFQEEIVSLVADQKKALLLPRGRPGEVWKQEFARVLGFYLYFCTGKAPRYRGALLDLVRAAYQDLSGGDFGATFDNPVGTVIGRALARGAEKWEQFDLFGPLRPLMASLHFSCLPSIVAELAPDKTDKTEPVRLRLELARRSGAPGAEDRSSLAPPAAKQRERVIALVASEADCSRRTEQLKCLARAGHVGAREALRRQRWMHLGLRAAAGHEDAQHAIYRAYLLFGRPVSCVPGHLRRRADQLKSLCQLVAPFLVTKRNFRLFRWSRLNRRAAAGDGDAQAILQRASRLFSPGDAGRENSTLSAT